MTIEAAPSAQTIPSLSAQNTPTKAAVRPMSAAVSSKTTVKSAGSLDSRIARSQGALPRTALNSLSATLSATASKQNARPSTA